jgi:hypothetical protein
MNLNQDNGGESVDSDMRADSVIASVVWWLSVVAATALAAAVIALPLYFGTLQQ